MYFLGGRIVWIYSTGEPSVDLTRFKNEMQDVLGQLGKLWAVGVGHREIVFFRTCPSPVNSHVAIDITRFIKVTIDWLGWEEDPSLAKHIIPLSRPH